MDTRVRVPRLARIAVAAYLLGEGFWLLLYPLFAITGIPGLSLCFIMVLRLHAVLMSALLLKLLRLMGEPASHVAALLLIPLIPIGVSRATAAATVAATLLKALLQPRVSVALLNVVR